MTTTADMVVFHGSAFSCLERHATSAQLLLAIDPATPHVIHRATERRQTLVGVKTGGGY